MANYQFIFICKILFLIEKTIIIMGKRTSFGELDVKTEGEYCSIFERIMNELCELEGMK